MDKFPLTTSEEDSIADMEGLRIVGELRKKYSNNNIRDLDIVLNSLCAALIRLTRLNVDKKDFLTFAELINKIIVDNLKK